MKTTVIHHSADMDGIFCREIARKFLPDAELVGWDFADKQLPVPNDPDTTTYILDLPVDRVFGLHFNDVNQLDTALLPLKNIIWIDHHASSIASHPTDIPGYRIDGVAACRLAWQWFDRGDWIHEPAGKDSFGVAYNEFWRKGHEARTSRPITELPSKQDFIDRKVSEPLAVLLAGEYDCWDCRPCDTIPGLSSLLQSC